jgi:ATP-dependent DNA ligase
VPLSLQEGEHPSRFEQLCYWVREEMVERDVIPDGEVVALDEQGRQDFRLLMRGQGNLH